MPTFSPIITPGEKRRFVVYDLEWYPETYEVRLVGVYDGTSFRAYPTVDAFLAGELTYANRGVTFFAHAGGLADVQFILERMLNQSFTGWQINAAFSGSSAIIVKASRGRSTWTFADSYWLLRDRLAKIGKSIGMDKGGGDYWCPSFPRCGHDEGKCIFYAPWGILKDYNEQDCRILWHAIDALQTELLGLGGELCMTIASCAMRLFRGAFLKRSIPTDDALNDLARSAYIASRVEVFRHNYRGEWTQDRDGRVRDVKRSAVLVDVNSSFPFSMTKPQPGRLLGLEPRWSGSKLALVRAEVAIPEMAVPPIPMRDEARVYFPVGSWKGWFSGVDLELAQEAGGTICKVHEAYEFEPFGDFADYVNVLYEMRRTTKDDFRKLLLKYLLNSCYGKTSEVGEKDQLVAGQPPRAGTLTDVREIAPGVWIGTRTASLDHVWVPIAMNITAESRALLTRAIWKTGDAMYCDTDSITTENNVFGNSDKLGDLKVENDVLEARFAAAKLYRMKTWDRETGRVTDKIRAKGFTSRKGTTGEEFDRLVEGEPMQQVRMLRVREVLASGNLRPRERTIEKFVRLSERPKRCPVGDKGETRPWDVREIQEESGQ